MSTGKQSIFAVLHASTAGKRIKLQDNCILIQPDGSAQIHFQHDGSYKRVSVSRPIALDAELPDLPHAQTEFCKHVHSLLEKKRATKSNIVIRDCFEILFNAALLTRTGKSAENDSKEIMYSDNQLDSLIQEYSTKGKIVIEESKPSQLMRDQFNVINQKIQNRKGFAGNACKQELISANLVGKFIQAGYEYLLSPFSCVRTELSENFIDYCCDLIPEIKKGILLVDPDYDLSEAERNSQDCMMGLIAELPAFSEVIEHDIQYAYKNDPDRLEFSVPHVMKVTIG